MALLPRDVITAALRALPAGTSSVRRIVKEFTFAGFPEAAAFVTGSCPARKRRTTIPTLPSAIVA